jgi:FtsH-binding integral membrane protein
MNISAIRPSWIAFGWFIAACVTGLGLLALISLGIADGESIGGDPWVAATLAVGFLIGGFFVGVRVGDEALIHGLGMGLFSLIVWFAANLLLGEPTDQTAWSELGAATVIMLLLLQAAAAVVGVRMGVRWAARGASALATDD